MASSFFLNWLAMQMKLVRCFEKLIAVYRSREYKIFSIFYFKSNRAKNGPLISELMRVVLEST